MTGIMMHVDENIMRAIDLPTRVHYLVVPPRALKLRLVDISQTSHPGRSDGQVSALRLEMYWMGYAKTGHFALPRFERSG